MQLKAILLLLIAGAVGLAATVYIINHRPVEPTITSQETRTSGADYSIGVKYPYVSGVRDEAIVNSAIWNFVKSKIVNFKERLAKRNPSHQAVAQKSAFYTEYDVSVFNPNIVTINFKVTSYFTGDAHPQTTQADFSYDLVNGSVILAN